tara:strand:- start:15119 stop:15871 length:753 start_codon:yes stop_codon:yes gene_type:complete
MTIKKSEQYFFSDFTITSYSKILNLALNNYVFCNYENYKRTPNAIIWRHDVDVSIKRAVRLSKIEFDLGIKSTFFIHIHNGYYNIFDLKTIDAINSIINCGHSLGIHLDSDFYDIKNEKELENSLEFEKKLFYDVLGIRAKSFSFHNPSKFILSNFRNDEYADLINVYSDSIKDSLSYISDSNGYWRFERLIDVITSSKYDKLQVLTHPVWWTKEIMSPNERFRKCLNQIQESNQAEYIIGRRKRGRKTI